MNEDDLRLRLAAIDPVRRDGALDPLPGSAPADLQERIMQTMENDAPAPGAGGPGWQQKPLLIAASIIALLAASLGVASAMMSAQPSSGPTAIETVELSTPSNSVMHSCVGFSVEILRNMSPAFAGTVVAVDSDSVTLDVDRWYRGGSADRVILNAPDSENISIDGVDFVKGERYLVTASEGTVNSCGFTGKATSELEQAFEEAFPR